jgi:hypothetical protein
MTHEYITLLVAQIGFAGVVVGAVIGGLIAFLTTFLNQKWQQDNHKKKEKLAT